MALSVSGAVGVVDAAEEEGVVVGWSWVTYAQRSLAFHSAQSGLVVVVEAEEGEGVVRWRFIALVAAESCLVSL